MKPVTAVIFTVAETYCTIGVLQYIRHLVKTTDYPYHDNMIIGAWVMILSLVVGIIAILIVMPLINRILTKERFNLAAGWTLLVLSLAVPAMGSTYLTHLDEFIFLSISFGVPVIIFNIGLRINQKPVHNKT